MSKSAMNLQDSFLNQVRRENSEVKVLLVNGTVLRGIVKGFDNFTLILTNRNGQHLVYKHAIAQLVSHRVSGSRREGEEETHQHSESTDGNSDTSGGFSENSSAAPEAAAPPPPVATAAPAQHQPQRPRNNDQRNDRRNDQRAQTPQAKKEGFNTLDLSNVKIGEKQEAASK